MIINRTVTLILNNKTSYEAFTNEIHPDQNNRLLIVYFKILGYKIYVQISKERRIINKKIKERAEMGILVEYEGTHIFKIYIPLQRDLLKNRIIRFSNVRFNEKKFITKLF